MEKEEVILTALIVICVTIFAGFGFQSCNNYNNNYYNRSSEAIKAGCTVVGETIFCEKQ